MDAQGISMNKRITIIEILLLSISISALILQLYYFFVLTFFVIILNIIAIILDKSKIKHNWRKEPDLLNDDRRNYNIINIGYDRIDGEGLDLTIKHSNLYSDFLILKRYYSLGKSGCTVRVNMKNIPSYFNKRRLSVFVLDMLHEVTLLEHGAIYYSYKIKWRTVFNTLLYFICNIKDDIQKCIRKDRIDYSLLDEINSFAEKRGISIRWYLDGKKLEKVM